MLTNPSGIKTLNAMLPAVMMSMIVAGNAHAGFADAWSELHVSLEITAEPLVNVNMLATSLKDALESGYGSHAEDSGGGIFAVNKIYDIAMFSSAIASSPPTSHSLSELASTGGEIAVIDNFSDSAKLITIAFGVDFSMNASASGLYSYAAATGAYSFSGAGSAEPFTFADRGATRAYPDQAVFVDRPNAFTYTFSLPAQGTYRITSAGSVVGSLAHAAEVPEPAGWALLMAGVGVIGVAFRERANGASRNGVARCESVV